MKLISSMVVLTSNDRAATCRKGRGGEGATLMKGGNQGKDGSLQYVELS